MWEWKNKGKEDIGSFMGKIKHLIKTKWIIKALQYIPPSLAAVLSYQEKQEKVKEDSDKPTNANLLKLKSTWYAKEKLDILQETIEEYCARILAESKETIDQQIDTVIIEKTEMLEIMTEQIQECLSFSVDKNGVSHRQVEIDLQKMIEARVMRYMEKFKDYWLVFDDEEKLFYNICMISKIDQELIVEKKLDPDQRFENWIQDALLRLIAKFKDQK